MSEFPADPPKSRGSPLSLLLHSHAATVSRIASIRLVQWLTVAFALRGVSRPFLALAPLTAALLATALESAVVRHARPSLRGEFSERIAAHGLEQALAGESPRLGYLFASARAAESLVLATLPGLIAVSATLSVTMVLAAVRFGASRVIPWALAVVVMLVVRRWVPRAVSRAADREMSQQSEMLAMLQVCLVGADELGRGAPRMRALEWTARAGQEWARAESARERVLYLRRASLGLLGAAIVAGSVLPGGHAIAALRSLRSPGALDLAWLLVFAPLVFSLVRSLDALIVAVRTFEGAGVTFAPCPGLDLQPFPASGRFAASELDVRFGESVALQDVTLDLPCRGITLVVGPNAAGKSTLARALAGLVSPTRGKITVGELPCASIDGNAVSYLAQKPAWLPRRSVTENVSLGAPNVPPADIPSRLARLGIDLDATRALSTLSEGQQRRLAVVRAVMRDPKLLILDEADAGLDRGARRWLAELVRTVAAQTPVVIVTHHPAIFGFADQVVVLGANHRLIDAGGQADVKTRCAAYAALLEADAALDAEDGTCAR